MSETGFNGGLAHGPEDPFDEAARNDERYDAERDRGQRDQRARPMANQISSSENERGDDHVVRAGWATRAGWVTRAICRPPVEHARFCRPGGLVRQVSLQRMGAAAISMPYRRKPSPRMGSLAAWSGYRYVPSDGAGGLSRGGYHLDVPGIRGPRSSRREPGSRQEPATQGALSRGFTKATNGRLKDRLFAFTNNGFQPWHAAC